MDNKHTSRSGADYKSTLSNKFNLPSEVHNTIKKFHDQAFEPNKSKIHDLNKD